jgi:hypothetical protein
MDATKAATSLHGAYRRGTTTTREDEHDGSEPDNDGEPSLWSFDRVTNQEHAWRERWGWPCYQDMELDNADHEATEPVLTECSDATILRS